MLFITTDKIKYSTVGASFTVTFSVAPDEINALYDLQEQYKKMNMIGFDLISSINKPQKKCHRDEEYACYLNPNDKVCDNCKLWYEDEV